MRTLQQNPPQQCFFSSNAPTVTSTPTASSTKRGGAGFLQRLSSFLVGAGLTALGTQYYIYQEIHYGNAIMLDKQQSLEKRIAILEKNK